MTRPKRPTLAELRMEARRVYGPDADLIVMPPGVGPDRPASARVIVDKWSCRIAVGGSCMDARANAMEHMRALPDWREP